MSEHRRAFRATLEVGEHSQLTGHAAVFGLETHPDFGIRERIEPGAFRSALAGADVPLLWQHDDGYILARTSSGTLRMDEDDTGLRFDADLPDTNLARDLAVLITRGDINGMSFGFTDGEVEGRGTRSSPRIVRSIGRLLDISLVTRPAYPGTDVGLRSNTQNRAERLRLLRLSIGA